MIKSAEVFAFPFFKSIMKKKMLHKNPGIMLQNGQPSAATPWALTLI